MLSKERNETLMLVGPDTPMGNYLRRYWHPIAGTSELDDKETKAVRLMGENLVLYKDLSGNYGLVDRHCAHRRADLSYGFVEENGIRCNYHGWCYDQSGQCIEQPYEDTSDPSGKLRKQVKIKAYPVEEKAGLLWAYLGPDPAPLVPNYEPFTWENGFVQIVMSEIPCNWFQCQENSCDPVHFEWMHENWSRRLSGQMEYTDRKHLQLKFEEIEHGFIYKRVLKGSNESADTWTVGRLAMWPNCFFLGDHFEWRVPVDDENTLSVSWFFNRVPKDKEPYVQGSIPTWFSPLHNPETGERITNYVMNQDILAWSGQGVQADRTAEHLGMSDRGIAMMRQRFFKELDAQEKDPDWEPKAIVRDSKQNECIALPIIGREELVNGLEREQLDNPKGQIANQLVRFHFSFGQPQEVRDAYEAATGIKLPEGGVDSSTGAR